MKTRFKYYFIIVVLTSFSLAGFHHQAKADKGRDALLFVVFGEHPPYHTLSQRGKLIGFDIDLAEAIGNKLDRKVVVQLAPETQIIDMVMDGSADAVLGITVTKEGRKIFHYSTPYLHHKTRLFIRQKNNFINTIADLRGLRVGVREGIDVKNYLRIVPGVKIFPEESAKTGLDNLLNHVTTVYMGDEYECDYTIQKNRLHGITTLGGTLFQRFIPIALSSGKFPIATKAVC